MFTSLLYAQEATEGAQHTTQGGGIMGFLSIVIFIIIFAIIYLGIKKRNTLIDSGKIKISKTSEANKKMFGIILTSLGGISAIISLIFFINEENSDFGIIIAVGAFIFIIGLILIFSSKTNINTTQRKSDKSYSNNLEALEKLSELKDKGIITEEEFNSKKKKILND